MAEKYFHRYCDSYGHVCRISIDDINFTGDAIELEGQEDPFLITYETNSDFLYDPIRPSSAEVNLTLGTDNGVEMNDMWTTDERRFKVIHIIDENIDWVGWMIPNGFEHEFRGGAYYVTITASDVLSTLEKIPFVYDDGNTYGRQDLTYNNGDEFPFSLIATEILRKLDFDINTWIADDVWEVSMNVAANYHNNDRTADPWSNSYVNVRTYINDSNKKNIPYWQNADEAWNCKDVMENILRLHGCILFQESGTWRILNQNTRENYDPNDRGFIRQWIKYNTLNVYIGKEPIEDEQIIQSSSIASAMIGDDHIMRMDDVFAAYRINYEFQFVREGDNARNLIQNPTFVGDGFNTSTQGIQNWIRWRSGNKWFPRARTTFPTSGDSSSSNFPPIGVNRCLEMGTHNAGVPTNNTDPNAAIWAAVRQDPKPTVVKGDKVRLSMWVKMHMANQTNGYPYYYGIVKIWIVVPGEGVQYFLVNTEPEVGAPGLGPMNTKWLKEEVPDLSGNEQWFLQVFVPLSENTDYDWWKINYDVPDIPDNGELYFQIHGLASNTGRKSDNFRPFRVKSVADQDATLELPTVRRDWVDDGGDIHRFQISDIRFEIIEPETENLVEELDYIYYNPNKTYTFNPDPVRVYNGDTEDVNHISKIIVPTRTSGKNFWFPVAASRGEGLQASLGLITAMSIMNQYYRPNRILEGAIKSDNVNFGTRFGFVAAPGLRWVLNRCTFNRKRNYIEDATFRQITTVPGEVGCPGSENPDEDPPEIPPDEGEEGGTNTDPNWVPTGLTRCRKIDNLNTGEVERQERDNNANSPTYNETRWILAGEDTIACPIGEPSTYWWGSDVEVYDTANFIDDPYFLDDEFPNEVQVAFNNTGNKYLFFLHRAGLGFELVERIYTAGQPNNIISDWQYLDDVVINGYTYRVLRTNYVLAEFSDFSFNFVFSTPQI